MSGLPYMCIQSLREIIVIGLYSITVMAPACLHDGLTLTLSSYTYTFKYKGGEMQMLLVTYL